MRKRQPVALDVQSQSIPQLLTIPEAAKCLNVGRSKVYDLIRAGSLPAVLVGDVKRVSIDTLRDWIKRNEQAS